MILAVMSAAVASCAPPEALPQRDPLTAEAYADVGAAEAAHRAWETAADAFREALRRDPANARAASGLRSSCAAALEEEGRRHMDAHDLRGAVEAFEAARTAVPSTSAALLEGICQYELGAVAKARPLLLEAERDPELAASAEFYLGLLALGDGDAPDAAMRFERAEREPALSAQASDLLRLARRDGRLLMSFLAESEFDSNVTLSPAGAPGPRDGDGAASLAVLYRPTGENGPFARAGANYRSYLQQSDYDIGAIATALGWQIGRAPRHLRLEYDYDYVSLGAAPYLSAHRFSVDGRWTSGTLGVAAAYSARFESYRQSAAEPYSGTAQSLALSGDWSFSKGSFLELGYRAGRDLTNLAETSSFEHGPRAALRLLVSPVARVTFEGDILFRVYDALDPALGVQRIDTLLDGGFVGEWDLSTRVTLRLTVGGRRVLSNVGQLSYMRMTTALGLATTFGIL